MKKNIYKITNKINNKVYIGQSRNVGKRFIQHMRCNSSSKKLSEDVRRYGEDSFFVEIIEEMTEHYNEKERLHIKKLKEEGLVLYNSMKGGEEPPSKFGKECPYLKYTMKQREMVRDLLLNTTHTNLEISKMLKVTVDFVDKINTGKQKIFDLDEVYDYPLRKMDYMEILANKIFDMLVDTEINQKEIAKILGVARSTVTMINLGEHRRREGIGYPLRKNTTRFTTKEEKEIIIEAFKTNENISQTVRETRLGRHKVEKTIKEFKEK